MDTAEAARRWAEVWTGAWPAKNVEAIVALYAEGAQYRALVLREPELGTPVCAATWSRTSPSNTTSNAASASHSRAVTAPRWSGGRAGTKRAPT